jgi:transcriptional regulator with PAS, ATPase and Fis domain
LQRYLPGENRELPVLYNKEQSQSDFSERELLYKVLFDMKRDINEMKKLVVDILEQGGVSHDIKRDHQPIITQLIKDVETPDDDQEIYQDQHSEPIVLDSFYTHEVMDESLSLEKREKELIRRAIEKHGGKRKNAAIELGISERTLYRKIKEYDIR